MNKNNLSGIILIEKVPIKHFILIMRTTLFLLFTCVFCSMADISYSQNAMVTINKRETSLQKLTDSFETGGDGLYNLMINDTNVLLTPKISITEKDIAEIPPLKDLIDSIELMEKMTQNKMK